MYCIFTYHLIPTQQCLNYVSTLFTVDTVSFWKILLLCSRLYRIFEKEYLLLHFLMATVEWDCKGCSQTIDCHLWRGEVPIVCHCHLLVQSSEELQGPIFWWQRSIWNTKDLWWWQCSNDKQLTVHHLEELTTIPKSTIHRVMIEQLKVKKWCTRCVPHLLSPEEKQQRLNKAQSLLWLMEDHHQNLLVTRDKSCFIFHWMESKQQNMVWLAEGDKCP